MKSDNSSISVSADGCNCDIDHKSTDAKVTILPEDCCCADQKEISSEVSVSDDDTIDCIGQCSKKRRFIWDALARSKEEAKLVTKLDWWMLSYVCLAEFIKYLDEANIKNAYVSGMKAHFEMKGNQYNLLTTWWTVGYILGHLPIFWLIYNVRIKYWLSAAQFLWGVLVISMAGAKDINTLYAIRFFIGFLQGPAFAGTLLLFSSWYQPLELAKRACIYEASSPIAKMISGYIQTGLYSHMNGKDGLESWQWLFIFDGIIGIPVALYGLVALPDFPFNTKVFWLTDSEKKMAMARMSNVNREHYRGKISKDIFWRLLKSPFTYTFTLIYTCHFIGGRLPEFFNLWLQSTGKYSVSKLNTLPTIGNAIEIVTVLSVAWFSDATQNRWITIVFCASVGLIGVIILDVWPSHNIPAMFAGWLLMYVEHGSAPMVVVWNNEIFSRDAELRALVLVTGETISYALRAGLPLVIYPSGNAPYYPIGYKMTTMFFTVEIATALVMFYFHRRQLQKERIEDDTSSENAKVNSC